MNWLKSFTASPVAYDDPPREDAAQEPLPVIPVSVNYFPHRQCNYACEFCFHTTKNQKILPLEDAKRGMAMLAAAGMKKMNISGGEPFLQAKFIGELFKYCKEDLGIESCSVVNNGSKVTEKWLDTYGKYLDFMAISIDSFDPETNIQLGRSDKLSADSGAAKLASKDHIQRVFLVAEWCRRRGIMVKLNSVITKLNHLEDMNESIEELNPFRWKVFQVLILKGENDGADSNSIRDGRNLVITDEQFKAFLDRHKDQKSLVPEDNETMKDSYLLLDEDLCFLNCQGGDKMPGRSILKVGVAEALKVAGFDEKSFMNRGGVFDWTRDEENQRVASEMEW